MERSSRKDSVGNSKMASFAVSPMWAQDAVNMTSASIEISFDHLRTLYQRTGGLVDGNDEPVSITLVPKFSGE